VDPGQLRAGRLRRQRGAASVEDGLGAAELLLDHRRERHSPRVHAVEDRGAQRATGSVGRQHARADPADAERADPFRPVGEELADQVAHVVPPHRVGVVLGPPRAGVGRSVRTLRTAGDDAVGAAEDGLAARRADVDAEHVLVRRPL
jgi:hypothetical protein